MAAFEATGGSDCQKGFAVPESDNGTQVRGSDYKISLLMLPGFSLMSFSAAVEPLRMANKAMRRDYFTYRCFSMDGCDVHASNGLSIRVDERIENAGKTDLLIIFSSDGVESIDLPAGTRQTVRRMYYDGVDIAGVCTSAFVLARLGLLRDRKCTIHWEYSNLFRECFPDNELTNCIFQKDRRILTCAGGDAAFDMMMSLVEEQCGSQVAGSVLDIALHNRQRPQTDHQRSDLRYRIGVRNEALIKCVSLMESHIEQPISMSELSARIDMSRRNLERLFKTYLKTSPVAYYRRIRLESARRLIETSDMPICEIALANGFESASNFSKCYRDEYGRSPIEDRNGIRPGRLSRSDRGGSAR